MTDTVKSAGREFIKLFALLATIVVLFVLYTCCYQVGEQQAVLLTHFERLVKLDTAPGLHFKYPWPIQRTYVFDLRTQIHTSPLIEIPTADGKNLYVRGFAHWTIQDPERFRTSVGMSADDADAQLSVLIQNEMRNTVNTVKFADIFTETNGGLPMLEDRFRNALDTHAQTLFGIKIKTAGFDRFELPEHTTKAVFARQKTEYEQQESVILAEAAGKAAEITESARAERGNLIAKATAEAAKIRAEAEAEQLTYLEVYKQEPELAKLLRRLQTAVEIFGTKTTIITTAGMPEFADLADSPRKTQ